MKSLTTLITMTVALILGAGRTASAQIGEPTGTFGIRITHGGTTVVDNPSVPVPPNPGFVQIGTIGGPNNPMILKIVSDGDPTFRVLHMYIDVPVSLLDINSPGPVSLFNPADPSLIDVQVTNMQFTGGADAVPLLVNNNSFFTAFMRDHGGHFYELPQANGFNSYGHGVLDIQVPGERFLDGDSSLYTFTSTSGVASSWTWGKIKNPGPTTTIHNGIAGGLPSDGAGYVFELGLAVAFKPEPTTATMLLSAGLLMVRRRRPGRN